ncbi:SPX [Macleaya cordata]|uniref:SPX n=1 Tax=Macleaya cordata TaxID=56857 RepID=A0A200QSF7_MACCD|nr:SPX [Macleaya cordata]
MIATLGPNGSHPWETGYKEEMRRIRNDIVNLHGEMVLLVNYSNINYTGLVKILKKYDKQTGGFLRLSFIQKVLQQPFFKTNNVSKLVKECENTIEAVFLMLKEDKRRTENDTTTAVGQSIFRNTIAALVTIKEMRISSTYSQFSLHPLNSEDSEMI